MGYQHDGAISGNQEDSSDGCGGGGDVPGWAAHCNDRHNNITRKNTLTVLVLQTDTVTARIEFPFLPREEVAISHDSTRVYFLTISPGNLYSFDLRTNQLQSSTISFQIAEGVRVAPNGLVYVTAGRYLVEVDGRSLTPLSTMRLTPERTRGVGFSGDCEYAFTNVDLIHLPSRSVTPWASNGDPTRADVLVAGNRRAIVGVDQSSTWYDVRVQPLSATRLSVGWWKQTTNEYPNARWAFAASELGLSRYSLTAPISSRSEALPLDQGFLLYSGRSGFGSPALLLPFNSQQKLQSDATPLPLVARVLDVNGRPLPNLPVTFESTVVAGTAITNYEGYAEIEMGRRAPGRYTVTARAGGAAPANYEVTVTDGPSGPATLEIVAGAGQLHNAFNPTSPLVVRARDSLGRPWPQLPVRFRLNGSVGRLSPVPLMRCEASECLVWTDSEGLASIEFVVLPEPLPAQLVTQRIVASVGATSVAIPATVTSITGGYAFELVTPAPTTLSGVVGATLPNAIRIRLMKRTGGENTGPLSDVSVGILNPGDEQAQLCEALTDSDGYANCSIHVPPAPGQYHLTVLLGGSSTYHITRVISLTALPSHPQAELMPDSQPQTGSERTFEFSAVHYGGDRPFGILNLLVNTALDGRQGCYVAYLVAQRQVYLVKDGGPEAGLEGPLSLGGVGSISNSQCTVLSAGSSVMGTGERPVVRLRVQFQSTFSGTKLVYLAGRTQGDAATSGWIPADVIALPPASGLVLSHAATRLAQTVQAIEFRFQNVTGPDALQTVWGLVGSTLNASGNCVFAYYVPGNLLTLYPDSGVPSAAPVFAGPRQSLENGQCRVDLGDVRTVDGVLTVPMYMVATRSFGGTKTIWGAANNLQNAVSPWTPLAIWQVNP